MVDRDIVCVYSNASAFPGHCGRQMYADMTHADADAALVSK